MRNGSRAGETVRAARARAKLSADELGTRLGVTARTIYLWENGSVLRANRHVRRALARILGINPAALDAA